MFAGMNISHLRLRISAFFFAAAIVSTGTAEADKGSSKESVPDKTKPPEKKPTGNDLLKEAVVAMSKLRSYHAAGSFSIAERKATLSGDFAVGAVDLQVLGFDGKIAFRRALKDKFWISHDSGKTWEVDSAEQMTALLSVAVTSPLSAEHKIWEQGEFAIVGGEKIGEEEVLHIQKKEKAKEAAMDFWLAKDPKLGLVIRRASFVIASDDGEFPVVMAYSELNEPVSIAEPSSAVPSGAGSDAKPK